ncbi:MAG: DUF3276 family protein [Bacteroidetes bacterium]|uniref:PUR family DNA/RNA-binding protein n=1 Tax=Phaeocystidibacter marisrubri TaxID=1577780 RepID=A0A6L3ZK92_9FLAO|nr:PUR family DNA/RNA-binding protein [Phaeocystidibacter marisrubri]KAB2817845.1 PUR family DNA/RNA-binding protein [Phaeocystidibacter marisrubri]TNE31399.1 MAG: DUF3276 family protein [Bacteroidota bacterium]GGH73239.1 DNA-binding protein [Phaeocystidibacter marisrubri]
MNPKKLNGKEEIFSKVMRAGRRTYFFDVRATRADDYYLTITESKKQVNEDGSEIYKKHKIYLYKEDFAQFNDLLKEVTDFIIDHKGEEVISESHDPNYNIEDNDSTPLRETEETVKQFSDVRFEDI